MTVKIDMNVLKALRDATLASLSECRNALIETGGDMEKAKQIVIEKGAAKAAKKADRETNEWLVKVINENGKVVGVKLYCETDFVAKNELFHELLDKVVDLVKSRGVEVNSKSDLTDQMNSEVNALLQEYIVKLGENMQLWDLIVRGEQAYVYNHFGSKISAIVFYEKWSEDVIKEVALQIAAMSPEYLSIDEVPEDVIANMKALARSQMEDTNKPAEVIEKIIAGKLNKQLEEVVLLEQSYIRDWAKKVKDILQWASIKSYYRFAVA